MIENYFTIDLDFIFLLENISNPIKINPPTNCNSSQLEQTPTKMKKKSFLIFLLFFSLVLSQFENEYDFGVCKNNYEIRYKKKPGTTDSILTIKTRAKSGYHFLRIAKNLNNPLDGVYITLNIFQENGGGNKQKSIVQLNGLPIGITIPGLATLNEDGFYSYDIMKHTVTIPNSIQGSVIDLDDLKTGKLSLQFGANYKEKPYEKLGVMIVPKPTEIFSQGVSRYYKCSKPIDTFEFYHPAIYSISLLFFILFFVLNLIFIFFKPLKNYGFLPLICSLALIFRLILKSYLFSTFEFQSTYFGYFFDNLSESIVFTLYFILPLNLIRFLILIDLSRQRIKVTKSGNLKN